MKVIKGITRGEWDGWAERVKLQNIEMEEVLERIVENYGLYFWHALGFKMSKNYITLIPQ